MASSSSAHIGIIGSGLIGKSWAMIFASVGYKVGLPLVFVQPTSLTPMIFASVVCMFDLSKTAFPSQVVLYDVDAGQVILKENLSSAS